MTPQKVQKRIGCSVKKTEDEWFSDECRFSLQASFVNQNERVYREVEMKADIPAAELVVEVDCHGYIKKYECPSKSAADFDVMHYSVWGPLQQQLSKSLEFIKASVKSWRKTLKLVVSVDGDHFEHFLSLFAFCAENIPKYAVLDFRPPPQNGHFFTVFDLFYETCAQSRLG